MSGKTLLASLLASCGLSAAATATAGAVASGKPDLSAEDQTAGTASLESLVEAAHAEGEKVGRKAERERFGTVLTDPGTEGKLGLAISLLSTTDLAPDAIMSNLKAASASTPAAAPAEPGGGQRAVADPKTADTIAAETGLVDTGAPREPKDGMDEGQVVDLWAGALGSVNGGGVTAGGVWGKLAQPVGPAN